MALIFSNVTSTWHCAVILAALCTGQAQFARLPRTQLERGVGVRTFLLDLDNDRDLDVVGSAALASTALYLGSGSFGPVRHHSGNCGAHDCSVGDIDLDGDLDVFSASESGACAPVLLINNGDGSFVDGSARLPRGGTFDTAQGCELSDVDGDGYLDAIFATIGGGRSSQIALNDGSGHFVSAPHLEFEPNIQALSTRWVTSADLDGDGDQDLLIGAFGGPATLSPTRILLNDGSGRFTRGQLFVNHPYNFWTQIADVDGDGDLDLALFGWDLLSLPFALYINDGSANFTIETHRISGDLSASGGAFADIDGDGDVDIVAVRHSPIATSVPGEFEMFVQWINDGQGFFTDVSFAGMPIVPTGYRSNAVVAGDIDGDGDVDVLSYGRGSTRPEVLWSLKRHLYPPREARLGTNYDVQVCADAGHAVALVVAFGGANVDLGPLGVWQLDPTLSVALPSVFIGVSRTATFTFSISTDPVLLDLTLHWQAIDVDLSALSNSHLMAAWRDTIRP